MTLAQEYGIRKEGTVREIKNKQLILFVGDTEIYSEELPLFDLLSFSCSIWLWCH